MGKICYYGDKLSANIARTPEGFIICQNVPIARTGYQQYLDSELREGGDPDEIVDVYRSPDEVFARATLASFEGKPVTNGHPDVDVTPDNYTMFAKGHVQNVRAGTGSDSDKILADLYITDPDLIADIQDGKREVSAGYYAEDKQDKQGRVCQTCIRGNHVAIVDEGRAGRSVRIRDSRYKNSGGKLMRNKKKLRLSKLLARYIKDASPEDLDERLKDAAEVIEEIQGEEEENITDDEELTEDRDGEIVTEEDEELTKDDDGGHDIKRDILEALKLLKELLIKLDGCKSDMKEAPLADEDTVEDEDSVEDEDVVSENESEDVPIEDDDEVSEDVEIIPTDEVEAKLSAQDAAIRAISRAALKIKNPADRKRVQDAIIQATRKKRNSQMSGIMSIVRENQRKKKDSVSTKYINVEKQQSAYDALNPHKKQ